MPKHDERIAGGKKKGAGKVTDKKKPISAKPTSSPKRHTKRHT